MSTLMELRHLGHSGLAVSSLALGTMSWGQDTDEDDAAEQLRIYIEAGGNFIDTADVYSGGASESIIGRLCGSVVDRDEVYLATKAVLRFGADAPRRTDASARHLLRSLDASLERLGTSYVDLWQLHSWDADTPLEESLAALDIAVSSGRVRYAGISNYTGWQTAKAATHQRAWPGRAPLVTTQVEDSLLARHNEAEGAPAAFDLGLGLLPWSPLGR